MCLWFGYWPRSTACWSSSQDHDVMSNASASHAHSQLDLLISVTVSLPCLQSMTTLLQFLMIFIVIINYVSFSSYVWLHKSRQGLYVNYYHSRISFTWIHARLYFMPELFFLVKSTKTPQQLYLSLHNLLSAFSSEKKLSKKVWQHPQLLMEKLLSQKRLIEFHWKIKVLFLI